METDENHVRGESWREWKGRDEYLKESIKQPSEDKHILLTQKMEWGTKTYSPFTKTKYPNNYNLFSYICGYIHVVYLNVLTAVNEIRDISSQLFLFEKYKGMIFVTCS